MSLERDELPERRDAVLTVIHLVFTTGHSAQGDALLRTDLTNAALDLSRVLATLLPDDSEVLGLLSCSSSPKPVRPAGWTPTDSLCCSPTKTERPGTPAC